MFYFYRQADLQHEFDDVFQLGSQIFGTVVSEVDEGLEQAIILLVLNTML